jgi:1,4-alpha-glucan branching enzyme
VTKSTDSGGLGFGFKWNMGWMHDTLVYMSKEPIHRQWHHHQMTFAAVYAWSENFILPISHDEVVHGKKALVSKAPGDWWQQRATLRALLGFMWAFPGKQLLFMGSELADGEEWNENRGMNWGLRADPAHAQISRLVRDLNLAYRPDPALWSLDTTPDGFRWIIGDDSAHNLFAFERFGSDGSVLVCVANFAAIPHEDYRIGLPRTGPWREVVNTDAESYGGSGVGNMGTVRAENVEWHGRPASAGLRVPPLGVIWLSPGS